MPTLEDAQTDRVFRALSSRPRREILRMLATGAGEDDDRCCTADEVCACVFAEQLDLGAPTVSHHMKVLADAGLVASEKRGLWVYYTLVPEGLEPILDELATYVSDDLTACLPRRTE